jgi:hypothetical protein
VIDTIAYDAAAVSAALRTFAGRIGHYLLCSSGAVYRDYPDWRQYRPVYEHDADLTYTGDLAYAEGKRAAEQVLMKHDLQIECTPLGVWLKETVQWFAHEYRGPASAHFADRALEIAAAQAWTRETSAGNAV